MDPKLPDTEVAPTEAVDLSKELDLSKPGATPATNTVDTKIDAPAAPAKTPEQIAAELLLDKDGKAFAVTDYAIVPGQEVGKVLEIRKDGRLTVAVINTKDWPHAGPHASFKHFMANKCLVAKAADLPKLEA